MSAPLYFSVSPLKLLFMSTATGGLYQFFWFYKQWRVEQDRTGGLPHPVFLTLYYPLASFALFNRLRIRARSVNVPCRYSPGLLFFFLPLVHLVQLPAEWELFSGGLNALPLLPVQAVALRINQAVHPDASPTPFFTFADLVIVGLAALIFGFRYL